MYERCPAIGFGPPPFSRAGLRRQWFHSSPGAIGFDLTLVGYAALASF
jgi:hypothetical protein